ncbi:MAG TPA: hypothetical protein VGZ47_04600 [Gemmataceae bacterium]|jgi:hypothetical protein|nr:hypothetical protein [Gemmataceae bacterium]
MFRRAWVIVVSLPIPWLCLAGALPAQDTKKDEKKESMPLSLTAMRLEVEALNSFYTLKATPEQMKEIQKLAKQTSQPGRNYKDPMVSDNYKQVLEDLHAALVLATDEDQIDNLYDQYDQLNQSDKPKFDDDFEISEAARKAVPKILRQFKSGQVAGLLSYKVDELVDPQDRLFAAFEEVRKASNEEWQSVRDDAARDVGYLTAGLDGPKDKRICEKAASLLDKARKLNDEEFKTQRAELEKQAKSLIGDLGPMDVLRHAVEYDLGRLLSNPRLAEALKQRLK